MTLWARNEHTALSFIHKQTFKTTANILKGNVHIKNQRKRRVITDKHHHIIQSLKRDILL